MSTNEATIVSTEVRDSVLIARVFCPTVGDRECRVIEDEVLANGSKASHRVAMDFSRVTMLPSVGLGMLIKLTKMCKASKGKLALFGLDENLTKLLRVSSLDRLLIVTRDEAQAIKKVA